MKLEDEHLRAIVSTDIVARLRRAGLRDGFAVILHQYVIQAADEIERLRNTIKNCPPVSESEYVRRLEDEIERYRRLDEGTVKNVRKQLLKQCWEVKRLREALQRIDGINDNPAIFNPDIEAVVRAALRRNVDGNSDEGDLTGET